MKIRWTIDKLVTISAVSISLFTLVVFMRQTSIIEKQGRMSALPYLYIETGFDYEKNHVTITLNNYGVGPAVIENILIFYEGDTYDDGFASFINEDIFKEDSINVISSSSANRGLALPPGDERLLVRIGGRKDQYTKAEQFLEKISSGDFNYQVSYRSIYGDKWRIHYSNSTPESY